MTRAEGEIPGWSVDGEFSLLGRDPELRLSIRPGAPTGRAAATHRPLFIPPEVNAVALQVNNRAVNRPNATLNVYFVPVVEEDGQLVPDESQKVLLKSWRLGRDGDLLVGKFRQGVPLADLPGELGDVGTFQFELLEPSASRHSIVELDNVELIEYGGSLAAAGQRDTAWFLGKDLGPHRDLLRDARSALDKKTSL